MPHTAANWPIVAAMLPFPGAKADGTKVQDAGIEEWVDAFKEVADAGFTMADLTDSWIRPGDLSSSRLDELLEAGREAGIELPAISVIRQSVIDQRLGEANLAYSHRTLEAAAQLGVEVVSFGLHQALSPEQQKQLWFWTVEGYKDPDDPEMWDLAVRRLRELGQHALDIGLLVSLEMYEDTYLGTGDSAVRLLQDIALPNVGINPDVGNLVRLHRPIDDWRETYRTVLPYTNYWHIKNYMRDENIARNQYVAMPATLETGVINYRAIVSEAVAAGFQGIICTEHYGGDGLSVCATNQAYLRRHALPKRAGYSMGASQVAQSRQDLTRAEG
ncbi:MAG: sugar phosphate isomerase/epimerase [Micrococcales bacterium]|nr:sugar phosphate isomerase/epimerase [Micrococcales bacterium]